MKTGYFKNIPITLGEVTIVKNENANTIMRHSCELARTIQKTGLGVLVINTGLSSGRFTATASEIGMDWLPKRTSTQTEKTPIMYRSSHKGTLAGEMEDIATNCEDCNINVVIITSWEWASSTWRRKESLLYALRDLMATQSIAVIVYSQGSTKTTAGCFDRGGTGRLATLALNVISIETSKVHEEYAPKEAPFVGTREELDQYEKSAQLLQKEINKLGGIKLNPGDTPPSSVEGGDNEDDSELALAA